MHRQEGVDGKETDRRRAKVAVTVSEEQTSRLRRAVRAAAARIRCTQHDLGSQIDVTCVPRSACHNREDANLVDRS